MPGGRLLGTGPPALAERFPEESLEGRFFTRFGNRWSGYDLVCRYLTPRDWLPLHLEAAWSNLALINPEVEIYKKREP